MPDALVYALGIAFSPVPIASVLLILSARRAMPNSVSFALGWIAGLAAVAVTLAVLVQRSGVSDDSPRWLAVAEIAVGVVFLVATAVVWLRRSQPIAERVIVLVDDFTRVRSAGLGVVLSGANPKVLALSLGAALTLAKTDPNASSTASTVALFVAIGAAGVLVPLGLAVAFPSRMTPLLASFRAWLNRHEAVALLVLGAAVAAIFRTSGLGDLRS